MPKPAKIQGHRALFVHGVMLWNDGQLGELLCNVLPVINRPPVLTEWEASFNSAFQTRTIITVNDVVSSGFKCACGECEDCQAHYIELLHRRY